VKIKQKLESVNDQLAQLHVAFVAGDRSAFFDALLLASQIKAPLPDWIADALLDVKDGLDSGRYRNLHDACGWTDDGRKKRNTRRRRTNLKTDVLAELVRYRLNGGSMTTTRYTQAVADKCGASSRYVISVYREHGQFIKTLPRKRKNKTDTYSFADIALPLATVTATA